MDAFGVVVIAVPVVGVVIGLVVARNPPGWEQIGGESPIDVESLQAPSRTDDEADLRALVAAKRARRQAAAGPVVASDRLTTERPSGVGDGREPGRSVPADGPAWAHLEPEVVLEARELLARRRARLERTGKPVPPEQAELERLLGPPHL